MTTSLRMEFLVLKEVMEMAWWNWCFVAVAVCSSIVSECYLRSHSWSWTLGGWEFGARFVGHSVSAVCGGIGLNKLIFGAISPFFSRRSLLTSANHTIVTNNNHIHLEDSSKRQDAGGCLMNGSDVPPSRDVNATDTASGLVPNDRHTHGTTADVLGTVIKEAVILIRCDIDALIFCIQTEDDIPTFQRKFWHKLCQIEASLSLISRMTWFDSTPFPPAIKRKRALIVDMVQELQEMQIRFYQIDQSRSDAVKELEIERKKAKVERETRIEIDNKYKSETGDLYADLVRRLRRFVEKAKEVLSDCGLEYAAHSFTKPQNEPLN